MSVRPFIAARVACLIGLVTCGDSTGPTTTALFLYQSSPGEYVGAGQSEALAFGTGEWQALPNPTGVVEHIWIVVGELPGSELGISISLPLLTTRAERSDLHRRNSLVVIDRGLPAFRRRLLRIHGTTLVALGSALATTLGGRARNCPSGDCVPFFLAVS